MMQAVVATEHTRDRTPAVDVDKEDAVVGEVGRVGLLRVGVGVGVGGGGGGGGGLGGEGRLGLGLG